MAAHWLARETRNENAMQFLGSFKLEGGKMNMKKKIFNGSKAEDALIFKVQKRGLIASILPN
jgi:hypothetical protein